MNVVSINFNLSRSWPIFFISLFLFFFSSTISLHLLFFSLRVFFSIYSSQSHVLSLHILSSEPNTTSPTVSSSIPSSLSHISHSPSSHSPDTTTRIKKNDQFNSIRFMLEGKGEKVMFGCGFFALWWGKYDRPLVRESGCSPWASYPWREGRFTINGG